MARGDDGNTRCEVEETVAVHVGDPAALASLHDKRISPGEARRHGPRVPGDELGAFWSWKGGLDQGPHGPEKVSDRSYIQASFMIQCQRWRGGPGLLRSARPPGTTSRRSWASTTGPSIRPSPP